MVFGIDLGGGKQESGVRVFPGVYETSKERRAFGDQLRQFIMNGAGNLSAPIAGYSPTQSSFYNPYQSSIMDRFMPTTAENDILNQVSDRTSAAFASRGLGATPIAASSTAASIAPTLAAMRQQQIENLRQALSGDVGAALTSREQDIGQRGGDITALLDRYRTKLQGLLNFFEQAYFPRALGQESSGFNFNFGLDGGKEGKP